ncbi:interleukin-13 receptor subunit alpha-2 isoform X3 [Tachyglossus aculeatus]|uniref:interleukin-13 receptor subunit alpha-2 isoform X3 n=1 Tax=Tachyglossus aculeatus TaxID=9261 RepID=UPI0018F2D46E|nr:interleukin-13 receptor subunit alpha-2 isoform X3 [Tachyglossus aculeatus]XP_038604518.1 interleukin-13 receptor subunit alpha-2 isoform X3 [Tachyglossus aculeatus]
MAEQSPQHLPPLHSPPLAPGLASRTPPHAEPRAEGRVHGSGPPRTVQLHGGGWPRSRAWQGQDRVFLRVRPRPGAAVPREDRAAPECMDSTWIYWVMLMGWLAQGTSSSPLDTLGTPQDLQIIDPGFLGFMSITWQPPSTLPAPGSCAVRYELKYRNAGQEYWQTVITTQLSYEDGFDLNGAIEAKVRTILGDDCEDGSSLHSPWAQMVVQPDSRGALGTRVQDLRCVYTNWEQLLCTWRPGEDAPPEADYHLYYWYHGLAQAQVCEDYILAGGRHVGCRFPSLQEAEYQDFNICVNGSFSSPPTSLQPTYFTLQLQNIVQPRPPEGLTLKPKDPEGPLLEWQPPHGLIPPACLEYHIQGKGPLGVLWEHRSADPKVALPQPEPGGAATCVHVRARVNMFCAQDGLWSEWSAELCLPESESRPQVLWAMSALGLGLIGAVVGLLLLGRRHKALLKPIPSVSGSPKALPRTGGEAEGCGSSGVLGV